MRVLFQEAALLNANSGGDNVNRGMIMGLLMGGMIGCEESDKNYKDLMELKEGLSDYDEIEKEINAFVECVL